MKKRPSSAPVASANLRVDASARASASAKYEVRKKITETIPEDVTRAKASAWLTIISPLTQWAGLKGDQLAYKREQLRLQQEEVLADIAWRARQKLQETGTTPSPAPNKFIVPFLESASLEDAESELVELWANLLVSAAEKFDPHYIHFTKIMSQMSGRQAKIFEDILGTKIEHDLEIEFDNLFARFSDEFLADHIKYHYERLKRKPRSYKKMAELLDNWLDLYGVEIKFAGVTDHKGDDSDGDCPGYSKYDDSLETDFEILTALSLVRYGDTGYFKLDDRWEVKVLAYFVTPLGIEFAKACKIIS